MKGAFVVSTPWSWLSKLPTMSVPIELAEDIATMVEAPAVRRAQAAAQAVCGEPHYG